MKQESNWVRPLLPGHLSSSFFLLDCLIILKSNQHRIKQSVKLRLCRIIFPSFITSSSSCSSSSAHCAAASRPSCHVGDRCMNSMNLLSSSSSRPLPPLLFHVLVCHHTNLPVRSFSIFCNIVLNKHQIQCELLSMPRAERSRNARARQRRAPNASQAGVTVGSQAA